MASGSDVLNLLIRLGGCPKKPLSRREREQNEIVI
jgi:hypothetical protein